MRPHTQQNQYTGDKSKDAAREKIGRLLSEEVKLYNFGKISKEAKYLQGTNSRLCGNITQLDMYIKSSETVNNNGNT